MIFDFDLFLLGIFFFTIKNTFPSQRSMYNDILYVKGHSTTPTSTSKPGSINRCNKEEYNRRRRKMAESPRNMMCRLAGILLLLVSLFSFFNNSFVHGDNRKHNKAPYTEEERMAEYVRQGYQFPFDTYVSLRHFILLYCGDRRLYFRVATSKNKI